MKKAIRAACAVILLSLSAVAQETPKVEVFGGYSYLHGDGGVGRFGGYSDFQFDRGVNLHGWNGSIAANLNNWFGLKVDFSGHYNSDSSRSIRSVAVGFPTNPPQPLLTFTTRSNVDTSIHNVLIGPVFSYRKNETLTPFGHALFGISRNHAKESSVVTSDSSSSTFHFSDNDTAFAASFGGGVDFKLSKKVAWRLVQADYLLTHFGSGTQSNARISTGIVFRFGTK